MNLTISRITRSHLVDFLRIKEKLEQCLMITEVKYQKPEFELLKFVAEDIITTSDDTNGVEPNNSFSNEHEDESQFTFSEPDDDVNSEPNEEIEPIDTEQ